MTPSRALDKTTQNQYFHLLCKHPDLLAELDQLRSKGQTMKSKKMMLAASLLALSLGVSNADEKKSPSKVTTDQMAVVVKRHYDPTARSPLYAEVVADIKKELNSSEFEQEQLRNLHRAITEMAKAEKHATNSLIALMKVRGSNTRAYAKPHRLVQNMIKANKMRLDHAMNWNILERYQNIVINGKILNYIDVPVESVSPTSDVYITTFRVSKMLNVEKKLKEATCDLVVIRFLSAHGRSMSSFAMQPKQLPSNVKLVKGAQYAEVIGGNLSKKIYDSGPRLKPIFKQRIHIAPLK